MVTLAYLSAEELLLKNIGKIYSTVTLTHELYTTSNKVHFFRGGQHT